MIAPTRLVQIGGALLWAWDFQSCLQDDFRSGWMGHSLVPGENRDVVDLTPTYAKSPRKKDQIIHTPPSASKKPDAPSSIPFQLPEQPSPCKNPVSLRRWRRNSKSLGGFLDGHSDEITQLHDLCLARFNQSEPIEDFVDGKGF